MKRLLAAITTLCLCFPSFSQGFLGSIDALMCGGRIGRAGGGAALPSVSMDIQPFNADYRIGTASFGTDRAFCDHLLGSGLLEDATALLFPGGYIPSDTLCFYRGTLLYRKHCFDRAAEFFAEIDGNSAYYEESFWRGIESMRICGNRAGIGSRLSAYEGKWTDMKSLEGAAEALLEGDYPSCRSSLREIGTQHFAISEAAAQLASLADRRETFKERSPLAGAVASAIIPGLGKVYAGRTGEGIATLLTVGAFGAMTAENWIECGPADWKTILFGTLGSLFYISGIYGSWVSVGLYNQNVKNNYETAVLATLHLPLDRLFN